jgi:hypothetical protein
MWLVRIMTTSSPVQIVLSYRVAGTNTDCVINSSPDSDFTITANLTETLNTCEPWGLTIKGGIQPYNISLPAVDSPFTTNVTVLPGFDHFSYINRAPPGTQLVAAVSDAYVSVFSVLLALKFTAMSLQNWPMGVWNTKSYDERWVPTVSLMSPHSSFVLIAGKSDVTCPGLDSSSGVASVIEAENAERARREQQAGKSNTALIAGVTVPIVVLLLGGIGFAFWFMRRKKQRQEGKEKFGMGSEAIPFNAHEPSGQSDYPPSNNNNHPSTITPFDASTVSTRQHPYPTTSAKHMEAMSMHPTAHGSTAEGLSYTSPSNGSSNNQWNSPVNMISGPVYDDYTVSGSSDTSSNVAGRRATRPSFAAFPTRSTRSMRGKAAEAAAEADAAAMSPDSEYASAADEIVIQHRDGGAPVIRELPPPYMDASSSSRR